MVRRFVLLYISFVVCLKQVAWLGQRGEVGELQRAVRVDRRSHWVIVGNMRVKCDVQVTVRRDKFL